MITDSMWHNVEASAAKEKTMVHNVEVEPVREVEEVIIKVPYSEGVCGDAESLDKYIKGKMIYLSWLQQNFQ